MSSRMSRRNFVKTGAAATLGLTTALSASKVAGANERVRAGYIGVANRGGQLIEASLPHRDLEVVAVCDVYEPYTRQWAEKLGASITQYRDFRHMLDRNDLDALFVATPDHWHAIQTIMACDAGKDVYAEKPLTITVLEGRRIVEAAKRNNSIVQVGVHRRSGDHFYELADLIKKGTVGKVTVARCYRISNMYPNGIGIAPDSDPPEGLDWDMWLGPRPKRPFNENIAPYKFRWWHLYSSQMANWGVHYCDVIRWMLGEEAPASVSAHGGKFAVNDARTIPDTMEVIFEFASGCLLIFGQYEASSNKMWPTDFRGLDFELRGTLGTVYGGSGGYQIIPERGGQFEDPAPRMEPMEFKTDHNGQTLTVAHIRNFLDCIKSRKKPNADAEVGHRSTTFSLLSNISLATKNRLEWDAERELITNNDAANELLHYEYRPPWKLG